MIVCAKEIPAAETTDQGDDDEGDIPTEQVAREAKEIDFKVLVDPYRSGYEAAINDKPRRPRECYRREGKKNKEKLELWFAGYDDGARDVIEFRESNIKAYAILNRPRRIN